MTSFLSLANNSSSCNDSALKPDAIILIYILHAMNVFLYCLFCYISEFTEKYVVQFDFLSKL